MMKETDFADPVKRKNFEDKFFQPIAEKKSVNVQLDETF